MREQRGGFTLLELLLAMALLAFVVSLALPRLEQLYLRFVFWLDQDRIEREIAGLGARAYLEGKTLRLATWPLPPPRPGAPRPPPEPEIGDQVKLTLPEGWRVVVEPAILFRPDGACSGGSVAIDSGDLRRSYRLEAPRCRLK